MQGFVNKIRDYIDIAKQKINKQTQTFVPVPKELQDKMITQSYCPLCNNCVGWDTLSEENNKQIVACDSCKCEFVIINALDIKVFGLLITEDGKQISLADLMLKYNTEWEKKTGKKL